MVLCFVVLCFVVLNFVVLRFVVLCFFNIGIINFAKPFLNFIDDTLIRYLNSKLDLNLSSAKDFQNLNSIVTWCIN